MSNVTLELGDDIMRQTGLSELRPVDATQASVKFDGKGTLHVMCRDGDDKLLKDLPVTEVKNETQPYTDYFDKLDELEKLRSRNKIGMLFAYLFAFGIILMIVLTFVMIHILSGG